MQWAAGYLLNGEQVVGIAIILLLVVLLILSALAYVLVRLSRGRLGKWSLLLSPLPFVVFAIGVWIWIRSQAPNSGPPQLVSANAAKGLIQRLPEYAGFSLTGAAYFDHRLYLGSNIGLLEIKNGAVTKLFQMQKTDSVVSGPWADRADRLLWVMDDHTHELLNFNGSSWQRVSMPEPQKGYYSRGEVLEGIKPVATDDGFWVAAAGSAWQWDAKTDKWIVMPQPQLNVDDTIVGVLPMQGKMAYIVRHELIPFLVKPGQQFKSDTITMLIGSEWHEVRMKEGLSFLSDTWTAVNDSGYICDKDGRLFTVSGTGVSQMRTAGACEAVAVDDSDDLLASFRGRGIFRLTASEWRQLSPPIPGSGQGDYWSHLAVSADDIAYVTDAQPVVDGEGTHGTDMRWKRTAETAGWIIRGGQVSRIRFE